MDNIFRVLGIQSREDCVSNVLAYAFNNSLPFRANFMEKICGKPLSRYDSAQAHTRVSTGESGIPDIIIVLESNSGGEIVVIENKLKAEEGYDQTQRYASERAVAAISNRFFPNKQVDEPSFIFLTLFPDQQPAAGDRYTIRHHSDLKDVINNIADWDNKLVEQLTKDWLALIAKFYAREQVNLNDIFFEKLADDNDLDGGYLYFMSAIGQMTLPAGLIINTEEFFRSSRQGRRFYGVRILKESWCSGGMTESSGSWTLDPFPNFNIHFEPQYNVLSGLFSCSLHYEVQPYEPEAWVKANIPIDQYDSYVARRENFSKRLLQKGLSTWSFGGGSNQLAKIPFDFKDSLYAEVKSKLEREFLVTSRVIDEVLQEM
ncbi:MAG: hypothetical protein C4519_21675 [Desulfobacteraceae bacterium]|nr:MAG: hypothetical protein C4519_21675 [Desulfobacteraceae bacterium]